MSRTTTDFGIDLGTTNSTIAVIQDTGAKVIPNKSGSGITPSAIWIDMVEPSCKLDQRVIALLPHFRKDC